MAGGIQRDKFDEMMVDIDTRLFDVQALLTRFVFELVEEFNESEFDVDMPIPFVSEDKVSVRMLVKAVFGGDNNPPLSFEDDRGGIVSWNEFDVASQYVIANYLHSIHYKRKLDKHLRRIDQ